MTKTKSDKNAITWDVKEWDKDDPNTAVLTRAISRSNIKEVECVPKTKMPYIKEITKCIDNLILSDRLDDDTVSMLSNVNWDIYDIDQLWVLSSAFKNNLPVNKIKSFMFPGYTWRQMNQIYLSLSKNVPFDAIKPFINYNEDKFVAVSSILRRCPNADVSMITESWTTRMIDEYEDKLLAEQRKKLREEKRKKRRLQKKKEKEALKLQEIKAKAEAEAAEAEKERLNNELQSKLNNIEPLELED